jgi:hypothetical protein
MHLLNLLKDSKNGTQNKSDVVINAIRYTCDDLLDKVLKSWFLNFFK